ncbi:unnamed protein product [Nesidiocoris tenuis]|uniref:Uncharacterized protein n=1 Tax=Nesidiocoris tenuis TaxID=355587 RepID=A0A6H5HC10_9HEMI|nr:unnamed protein product [Nesidiocoris tenuis]
MIACLKIFEFFSRPSDRTGRDIELICGRLKRVDTLSRLPHSVISHFAQHGYYEDIDRGVTQVKINFTAVVFTRNFNVKLSLVDIFSYGKTSVSETTDSDIRATSDWTFLLRGCYDKIAGCHLLGTCGNTNGRNGYFKDLLKLYRVNEAELTSFGNTTNLKAGFYLSNAHLHYRFTLSTVEFDVDLKFFQNLFNVNVNYTAEHPCTIEYAPDSIDVSLLGGSDVTVRVDALHNNIVPEYVRDFVESTIQFGVESTINTGLVLLATRMALSSYVVTFLTENTGKIDVCDVFRSVTSQ